MKIIPSPQRHGLFKLMALTLVVALTQAELAWAWSDFSRAHMLRRQRAAEQSGTSTPTKLVHIDAAAMVEEREARLAVLTVAIEEQLQAFKDLQLNPPRKLRWARALQRPLFILTVILMATFLLNIVFDIASKATSTIGWHGYLAIGSMVGACFSIVFGIWAFSAPLDTEMYLAREIRSLISELQKSDPSLAQEKTKVFEEIKRSRRGEQAKPDEPSRVVEGVGVLDTGVVHDTLPAEVISDLDLFNEQIGLVQLLDRTHTVFGYERLRWLVTHPYLDVAYIQKRQVAEAELINSPDLRVHLKDSLNRLGRAHGFQASADSLGKRDFFRQAVLIPRWVAMTTISVILLTVLLRQPLILGFSAFPLFLAAPLWIQAVQGQLTTQSEWRNLFATVQECHMLLQGAQAPLLQEIKREFDRLLDPEDPTSLAFLVQKTSLGNLHHAYLHRREDLERLVAVFVELEVLYSLSEAAVERPGRKRMPQIIQAEQPEVVIRNGHHPATPSERSVGNDVMLIPGRYVMNVSGPNEAGKSTAVQMVALEVIQAQMGHPSTAEYVQLTPVRPRTHFSRKEQRAAGRSTFAVDSKGVAETVSLVDQDPFYLLLFDDSLHGTNTPARVDLLSTMEWWSNQKGVPTVIATHDLELTREPGVSNWHFAEEASPDGTVTRTYRLQPGSVTGSNAARVFIAHGVPDEFRAELERRIEARNSLAHALLRQFRKAEQGEARSVSGMPPSPGQEMASPPPKTAPASRRESPLTFEAVTGILHRIPASHPGVVISAPTLAWATD